MKKRENVYFLFSLFQRHLEGEGLVYACLRMHKKMRKMKKRELCKKWYMDGFLISFSLLFCYNFVPLLDHTDVMPAWFCEWLCMFYHATNKIECYINYKEKERLLL